MSNLVKRVRKFSFIAVCLSLVLGVMGAFGVVPKVNANDVIMQTIYTTGDEATLMVKVSQSYYLANGVTLTCTNGDAATAKTYTVTATSGTTTYADGNYATTEYSDESGGIYVVTYKVQKSTIATAARAYFTSGTAIANNGGYGYYIFE